MSGHVLNVHEAAELLGISAQSVRLLARKGEIPAMKYGQATSPYRFRRSSLEAWMEGKERARRIPAVRDR